MNTVSNRHCLFFVALSFVVSSGAAIAIDSVAMSGGVTDGTPAGYHANDAMIWDNGAAIGGAGSSQIDTVYPFDSQVADDFRLRDQNPGGAEEFVVTGVSWTGLYWSGVPGNPTQGMNILFYADAGGMPTGAGPTDPSNTALLSQFFPIGDTNETFTGIPQGNSHTYDVKLDIPFLANTDTTYWIGIQAVLILAPQWGWHASANGVQGNASRQGFPLLFIDYWDGILADQSFQLSGFEVPEPTGMALLAAGGWALLRRRR